MLFHSFSLDPITGQIPNVCTTIIRYIIANSQRNRNHFAGLFTNRSRVVCPNTRHLIKKSPRATTEGIVLRLNKLTLERAHFFHKLVELGDVHLLGGIGQGDGRVRMHFGHDAVGADRQGRFGARDEQIAPPR